MQQRNAEKELIGKHNMGHTPVEMICSACGKETLLVREPKYDGFVRVGEKLICSACGYEYASEKDVPFKEKAQVQVFTADDQPKKVKVFEEGENSRLCRYCDHYVVNPFMQWCGYHKKEVQATDSCEVFAPRNEREEDEKNEEET